MTSSRILALSLACLTLAATAADDLTAPKVDFDRLVFVKRQAYNCNHYYTEYINSNWKPGGNISILDLKTSKVKDILPAEFEKGVVERFDLSFDAKRIVFAWKSDAQQGYRIYEVNVDGSALHQLTRPQDDEAEVVKAYRVSGEYHHGTDDLSPCYLPDGGIAFISTRCQYGILCDGPDNFTTTLIYRMDGDGKNLRKLSNNSVSEASPAVMPDGRIMYNRWEYVDKGAVSVKCLWSMRPDGSGSSEIYKNDIALPPTFIYGRPIPGFADRFVVLGTPHYPQDAVGTVIRLDMTKNIRTREPMTYMTPYVDVRGEGGFSFADAQGNWHNDGEGRGPLFKDPYPISNELFLVAHKPQGEPWSKADAWSLYWLDEKGRTLPLYREQGISCWMPYPLKPRKVPPVIPVSRNEKLAKAHQAKCIMTDVYQGLENIPRGSVKWLRIIEQVPRPWAARRRWGGDLCDQQHACITLDTHLGLKVQHGVVPVEDDGSANFLVPAETNIILQALDQNFMAVQTERTFVNYMPGETRGCIGCHETPHDVRYKTAPGGTAKALKRPSSLPGPQPGEAKGQRPLYYPVDVQPVWDRHCLKCHAGAKKDGGLDLSGTLTERFSVSYESLVRERSAGRGLSGLLIGENHGKTDNVAYLPAKSLGSHSSVLVAMLAGGKVTLADAAQAARVEKLKKSHQDVKLTREELIRVSNWVDTNGQYYGMWWGRRNLQYKDLADFRPVPTFEQATSYVFPVKPEGK